MIQATDLLEETITKEIEESVIEQLHDTISIYDNSNIFGKFEKEFATEQRTLAIIKAGGIKIRPLFPSKACLSVNAQRHIYQLSLQDCAGLI